MIGRFERCISLCKSVKIDIGWSEGSDGKEKKGKSSYPPQGMTNDAIKKLKETEDELLRILPKMLEKTSNQKIELKIKASNSENLNGLITLINSRNVNSLLQRI